MGQQTPLFWIVLALCVILIPLLMWVLRGVFPETEPRKVKPTQQVTRSSGKHPLDGWKPTHRGVALEEPEPVITNGVPAAAHELTDAHPDESGKDALIHALREENTRLRQRPSPEPAKTVKEDPEVSARKAEAKKRAEERRKADELARKTLVFLSAPKTDQTKRLGFHPAPGGYQLIAGRAKINCILETALNSDIPAPVIAKVTEPVYDSVYGDAVLIPPESTLTGQQRGNPIFGENRVPLAMTKLSYPRGGSLHFGKDLQGLDGEGRGGLTGDVNNHWGRLLVSVVLTGVLRGGVQSLGGGYGVDPTERIGGAMLQDGASEGAQRTKRFLNSNPTIEVPQNSPCLLIVDEDISFPARAVEAIHGASPG